MATERLYRVGPAVGKGGFGTVYQAEIEGEAGFRKRVALKMLNADLRDMEEIRQRMRDEARMLGLVRHRAIVQVDGLVRLSGRWTLVIEWVDGVDLDAILRTNGPVPPGPAMEILEEIASALEAAFDALGPDGRPLQLLHRDIKPGNIRVTAQGSVKVLDFGVARARFEGREAETQDNIFGSLAYMAPERLHHEEHASGDVWSLGILLCETLLARPLDLRPIDPKRCKRDVARHIRAVADLGTPQPIVDLARSMLSWDADRRPTARDVARTARRLSRSLGSEPLPDWAERVVPLSKEPPPQVDDELQGQVLTEDDALEAAPRHVPTPVLVGHLPTPLDNRPAKRLNVDSGDIDLGNELRTDGVGLRPGALGPPPELTDLGRDLIPEPARRDDEETVIRSDALQAAIEEERRLQAEAQTHDSERRPEREIGTLLIDPAMVNPSREVQPTSTEVPQHSRPPSTRSGSWLGRLATAGAVGIVTLLVGLIVVFTGALVLLPSLQKTETAPNDANLGLDDVGAYERKVTEPEPKEKVEPKPKRRPVDPVTRCFASSNVSTRALKGELQQAELSCLARVYHDSRNDEGTRLRAAIPATDHYNRVCDRDRQCSAAGIMLALAAEDLGSDSLPYLAAYASWLSQHGDHSDATLRKTASVAERALAHPSAQASQDLGERLHKSRTMSAHELWTRDSRAGRPDGESRARAWDASEDWAHFRTSHGEQADIAEQICREASDGKGRCSGNP